MHEVKVDKRELLEKLEGNRDTHVAEYKEAIKGYKQALEKVFVTKLQEVREGKLPEQSDNLPKPQCHKKEYDRVITMVKMSVEDELTLSAQEFSMFVMDDWGWKQTFTATNMAYSG